MLEGKIKNQKSKIKNTNQNLKIFHFGLSFCSLIFALTCFAQDGVFIYDAKAKRDPFIPLVTSTGRLLNLDKEEVRGDLFIEGIIYDKNGRSYAIVNASVVGVGDFVGEYQVLKIQEKKVSFIKEGEIREIEISKEGE